MLGADKKLKKNNKLVKLKIWLVTQESFSAYKCSFEKE